jgi:hypothetical protein
MFSTLISPNRAVVSWLEWLAAAHTPSAAARAREPAPGLSFGEDRDQRLNTRRHRIPGALDDAGKPLD